MPVEIGLPLAPRADHDVHGFGATSGLTAIASNGSLEEPVRLRRHFKEEIRILGLKNIAAGREASGNGFGGGWTRRQVMSGMGKVFEFLGMARMAGVVADVVFAGVKC